MKTKTLFKSILPAWMEVDNQIEGQSIKDFMVVWTRLQAAKFF